MKAFLAVLALSFVSAAAFADGGIIIKGGERIVEIGYDTSLDVDGDIARSIATVVGIGRRQGLGAVSTSSAGEAETRTCVTLNNYEAAHLVALAFKGEFRARAEGDVSVTIVQRCGQGRVVHQ